MAAYSRGKKGALYIHVPAPGGGTVIRSTGTADPDIARDIEDALAALKRRRMWDVLAAVVEGRRGFSLDNVRDAWAAERLSDLRERLGDVDLEPEVERWQRALRVRFAKKRNPKSLSTPDHYLLHVRTFVKEGEPMMRSEFTADALTAWLEGLPWKPATKTRYWAAMSSFAKHLVAVKLLEHNPMDAVPFPKPGDKRVRYLTMAEIERLLDALDEPYRTVIALTHATGMEYSALDPVRFKRSDIVLHPTEDRATVHAHGTKTPHRDRVVQVDAWAVPALRRHVQGMLPNAPVFPFLTAPRLFSANRKACKRAGITDYTVHDARHSYAVRYIAAGVPAEFVARQLGHKDTKEVTTRYGRFIPTDSDAARYQRMAEARDAELRQAK